MKITLVCFAVLIAYVAAEQCRGDGDCNLETCSGDGWTVNCHNHVCTCDHTTHTGSACTSLQDCASTHCGGFANIVAHCVDGNCRCRRPN